MTSNEAQKLFETAVRLIRGYAESMPMWHDDGHERRLEGLTLDAQLELWSVPQAVAAVHGAVSVDSVGKLLRHLKANCWAAIGAENQQS